MPRQDAGYPLAPRENGIQWRRAGKTGWARWRMTYYRKPDSTKAQKREYINYVSDKALGKIYRIAGGKNG